MFLARGKVMPGVMMHASMPGLYIGAETALLWLVEQRPGYDGSFLGSQVGIHAGMNVLHRSGVDINLGLGPDFYWLWGMTSSAAERALALRAEVHYWPDRTHGLVFGARVYPLATDGLQLGEKQAGGAGWPVLFTLGVEIGGYR